MASKTLQFKIYFTETQVKKISDLFGEVAKGLFLTSVGFITTQSASAAMFQMLLMGAILAAALSIYLIKEL